MAEHVFNLLVSHEGVGFSLVVSVRDSQLRVLGPHQVLERWFQISATLLSLSSLRCKMSKLYTFKVGVKIRRRRGLVTRSLC